MNESGNPLIGILQGVWRVIDRSRRVAVNLLFVVIVVVLLVAVFSDGKPEIADTTALVIAPEGRLVEQLTARTVQRVLEEARGSATPETLLKDVLDTIAAAKNDDRVEVLVLDLSNFMGARLTKLQDVAAALDEYRAGGKRVIARADMLEQDGYYLASHADEIWIHEMGGVILQGYGRYKMYFKEGIDKLGLDFHVFRVGTFKSYVEPFLRNDMSEAAREANNEYLGDLWRIYLRDVAAARGMSADQLDEYAQDLGQFMAAAESDPAKAALDFGLVDETLTRVEMRERLIALVGEDETSHSYNKVVMGDYLEALDEDRFGREAEGELVAVVVARGSILDGSQPAGTIGGDSTAALIRQARNNEDVKAIVLRVDSGGGSAFASEVIRRECEAARRDGKPVVASMGSVAASGGYWISTSSDQIWAHESTITGSIGILGIFPTYQRPLAEKLGIHVDGVSTAPLVGVRPDRELPKEVGDIIQGTVEHGYQEFLQRVADSREMSLDEVDKVAQGRVWSGTDAHDLGLVDHLGGLKDAIAAAAELAELGDDYEVTYIEEELEWKDRVLGEILARSAERWGQDLFSHSPLDEMLLEIRRAAADFGALNDPNHAYAISSIDTD